MSLLLDALKRAEDAKRLKKSEELNGSLFDHELPANLHPQPNLNPQLTTDNIPEPAVPLLSLEEMHAKTSAAASNLGAAPATILAASDAVDFSLEQVAPIVTPNPSRAGRIDKPSALLRATGTTTTTSDRHANSAPADWSESDIADIAEIEAEQSAKQTAKQRDQRDAAKNVFAAKRNIQVTSAASSKKKWVLPLIALLVVGIGGGAWYVWNEINKISQPSLPVTQSSASPRSVPPPANPLPPAQPSGAALTPGSATTNTANKAAELAPVEAALPPLLPPPAKEIPLPKLVTAPIVKKSVDGEVLTERELLAQRLQLSSNARAAKEAPVSLKLSQTIDPPKVSPVLLAAYTALSKGDYADAKKRYGDVVRAEPYSLDAQLGLATAAARTGDNATAAKYYRQALALDPRNATALSGLIAVSGEVPIEALETELKTWVVKNPNSAPLQFSLGNLYAGQRRWTEAQQAYFDAYRIDSTNADYLYNLAVSLDQLNQYKLALEYYQKALGQLGRTGGQFDRASVVRRVGELKANLKAN